ncbi:MAG: glycosyltransferase [Acidimicrobiaceae bacterium]|nr:glycosyltransferase [Ilumatobacter sp.]MCB9382447.1 glycosyltransferase [Acidimicrobiaceae bacterium]MCO5329755.1 glycosyltransferase [Ilumatobacteraceae bacterium]
MKIVHVISEFSAHEAMGRTIAEVVARVPGEHVLVTVRVHDGADRFARVHEVGGSLALFALQKSGAIAEVLEAEQPDVVHLHGGALTAAWALSPALRSAPMVHTVYGWPRLPRLRQWRLATVGQMRRSNVLRARVAVTSLLRPRLARLMLRISNTSSVLTPDGDALQRLSSSRVPVRRLPSGAALDPRRAEWRDEAPVVVFAGRAEMVRGVDVLLRAFPVVRSEVPGARLRLLLIPTADLPDVLAAVDASGLGDAVEVVTDPVADLAAELAAAQLGVWPFKFDYTTSPPAMAVAEAMAVGLPVVSTDVTCVRAIAQDGDNAVLVAPGDHRRLAGAIVQVLSDEFRWTGLADAGRRTVQFDASWEAAASVTGDSYRERIAVTKERS